MTIAIAIQPAPFVVSSLNQPGEMARVIVAPPRPAKTPPAITYA
jgi:hypothetical protein